MKMLYLDCFSGISGNMFIGMLLHAGVPFEKFKAAMELLGVTGYSLVCTPVSKLGIQSVYYNVELEQDHHHGVHDDGGHHDHHHDHESHSEFIDETGCHHHHQHRGLPDITKIIEAAPMENSIKKKSISVFETLAKAESKVHGVPVDQIHFHEVGAIDCILDIVGTIWCLQYLEIEKIGVSPLNVGSGFVRCAHGIMPVPAPATAELLAGLPYYSTDVHGELVTPTGAALVKCLVDYVGPRPKSFIHNITAYGAGTKELPIPNVLRGFIGRDL